ncbi:MAG: TetR/AcrR family transcriptional regulator [Herbinix sp.]|nr:TetR/AcrR family transcriptional regulator [Herbinix sp.]
MDKRELILNAMQELLKEGNAGIASVSDIARKAGIAKGGIYYYFRSKEEIIDELVDRQYSKIISDCRILVEKSDYKPPDKLGLLLRGYSSGVVDKNLDVYLHSQENAYIHQKSLAKILMELSPIVTSIIEQGNKEGDFKCEYPKEYAEIALSVFTFLLDPGIFEWSKEEITNKMKALANILEKGLGAKSGTFSFLYGG